MMQTNMIFEPKDDFLESLKSTTEGKVCPCCDRFAKVYKRKIHCSMALQLIALYKKGGEVNYIHGSNLIPNGVTGIGDLGKNKYWGLIQEKTDEDEQNSKSNGYWKLTSKGVDFVKGYICVPKYAKIYNDKVLGFDNADIVYIKDCLSNKFNYKELMTT